MNTTALSDAVLSARALDKPVLIGGNRLDRSTGIVTADWRLASGASVARAGYPTERAWDGFADVPTTPLESVAGTVPFVALVLDLHGLVEFDSVVLCGLNAGAFGSDTSVTVQISDSSTFSGATTLGDPLVPARIQPRMVWLANTRYSSVGYLRVIVERAPLLGVPRPLVAVPEIGEVHVGLQYQLARRPNRPWDPRNEIVRAVSSQTKAGATVQYFHSVGQRRLSPEWSPTIGGDLGLDDASTLRGLWTDSQRGRSSVVYIDRPTSSPGEAMLMRLLQSQFSITEVDAGVQSVSLELEELPPYVATEN
jgi:hypothetical protein